MAWTAIYLGSVKRDGQWAYSIVYSDGTKKVVREYVTTRLDDAAVKQTAIVTVSALTAADADTGKVSIAAGSVIDLTPPVVQPPSDADVAQSAYFEAVQKATEALRQQAAGAGVPQKTLDTLTADVAAKFKPEYVG